jgi:hypothetical protein
MRKPITTAVLAALVGAGAVLAPSYDVLAVPQAATGAAKVLVPKGVFAKNQPGVQLIEDYGSFALYRADAAALRAAQAASSQTQIDSEADTLQFTAHPFDTQRDTLVAPAPFALTPAGAGLQVVQFVGPVKQEWLDALAARGITPVQYVANSGYIVWADNAALVELSNLRNSTSWLQYNAPLHGFWKVDPRLSDRLRANPMAADEVDITVQVYSHAGVDATKQFITSKGLMPVQQLGPMGAGTLDYSWAPILKFENLSLRVRMSDVAAIAQRPDVTFVGENLPRRMMDEKQDIIMSGDFFPTPASINYLQFLLDRGFSQDPEQYPVVDVTDSPVHEGGTGATVVNTADPMMHVGGDINNPSRVTYFRNCSNQPTNTVGGINGHGSLNGGIVIGYDQRTGSPFEDTDGHQLGLGINPFGRIGSTGIFTPVYSIAGCGNTDQGVIRANWEAGAKISSNSWGLTVAPTVYDAAEQAYDAGTRDATSLEADNQELIYIFAAANLGPGAGSVSSPGAAKNIITVGASENVRPGWTDGCGIGTSGADHADDVISFSGRGPAPGQRAKPEVIGPGTHVQAGADIYSGYDWEGGPQTAGVCDPYHPNGQTTFAASSGTSHSTPATAGIASLSWWWIVEGGAGSAAGTVDEIGGNRAPSPALMKAWMMAHPSYLTGVSANDNLPSNSQGYGMPNMSDMFSDTPKVLLDQSEVFDNSGETRTYTWGVVDTGKPVRIAMAYTDAPGALGTSPQVNNLDLTVVVNGQTYLGNEYDHQYSITGGSPDTKNNYEAVFLPAGTSGDIEITITATNIAGDGIPHVGDATDQDFGLVCSNCSQAPTFTLQGATDAEICAGTPFSAPLTIGQIQGYNVAVNLAASGNPSGTTASVDPPVVTPPGTADLNVTSDTSVVPGDYIVTVTGTSGAIVKTVDFGLSFFTAPASTPALDTPGDGANSVPLQPVFTWEASDQAASYLFELATDAAFSNVVISETVEGTSFQPSTELGLDTEYWWRVSSANTCGGNTSAIYSFRTAPAAGECSTGTTTQVLFDDPVVSGDNLWTHEAAAGTDTWTISGSRPNSPPTSWKVVDSSSISDQRLTSNVIALPADLGGLNFQFQHWPLIEGSGSTCADGGVLEVAVDGGAFTQIPAGQFLQGAYNGTVGSGSGNPLAGSPAWCGLASAYDHVIVDVSPYAGHDAQFRFRLGTNNTSPREGWYIDDIKVQGCGTEGPGDTIFADGFEAP